MRARPLLPSFVLILACAALCWGCGRTAHHPTTRPPGEEPTMKNPVKTVSFEQDAIYRAGDHSYRATLDFDQPTVIRPAVDANDYAKLGYAKAKDYAKLIVDLDCILADGFADDRRGPLSDVVAVYVYGADHAHRLGEFIAAKGFTYRRQKLAGFENDGRGPIVFGRERIRVRLGAAIGKLVQHDRPYGLTFVAVDGQGRTVMSEMIMASEESLPIGPRRADQEAGPESAHDRDASSKAPLPKAPPPRAAPSLDLDADASVGVASMAADGTLNMQLRSVEGDGTIAECLLIVPPSDARYPGYVAHLGSIKPGQSRAIPPFP